MSSSTTIDTTTTTSDVVTTPTTTSSVPPPTTTTTPPPVTTSTTVVPTSTSITSAPPTSTSIVPPPTTVVPSTSIIAITSTVTQTPTNISQGPTIVTITSTQAVVTTPGVTTSPTRSSSSTSSSASASQSALSASGNAVTSKGLSNGATIAIAVIIPIVAVAAAILFGIFFWRRRRNRKNAEELRKNEMAEYGFNPNHDPTLPVAAAAYTDGGSEANDDSGYRGWGATTVSGRKTSTTLGSNSRAAAMGATGAMSDGGSQPGGYNHPSPPAASDGTQEPLMAGHHDTVLPAAVAGGAVTGATLAALNSNSARNQRLSNSIHRGPSNASSAYSAGGALSEVSSEHNPMPGPYTYQEEVPYNVYNESQNPYGDGAHHPETPVIRDVQARRNTRIERAPTFPQQGGIAQNF